LSDENTQATTAAGSSSPIKLLVKVLVLGDTLLTTLATDNAAAEPKVLELAISDYIVGSSSSKAEGEAAAAAAAGGSSAKAYKNLDQLAATVTSAMLQLVGAAGGGSSSGQKKQKTETAAAAGASRAEQQQQQQQPDPDHDPLRIGPPRRPMRVGECNFAAKRLRSLHGGCCLHCIQQQLVLDGLSCACKHESRGNHAVHWWVLSLADAAVPSAIRC
jgi:hypothetical protein